MKLVFLAKRRPMGRDLVTSPYGRFFHLPRVLADRGHEVFLQLLSYQRGDDVDVEIGGVRVSSRSALPSGPVPYLRSVDQLVRSVQPDWIVGLSDIYFGIAAHRLARRHNLRLGVDAYDNYEAYFPRIPPMIALWRRALAAADLVTAAGPPLLDLLASEAREPKTAVVPMAADPHWFEPARALDARSVLGLPGRARLVGYAGGLHPSRGLEVLFKAARKLAESDPSVRLVLSGRKARHFHLPMEAIWLGTLPVEQVPMLFGGIDVLAVINQRSAFGDHSYPVKLYEAMAVGTRVVVTETPATRWILKSAPECLVEAGSVDHLVQRIRDLLDSDAPSYGPQPGWEESGLVLERALLE